MMAYNGWGYPMTPVKNEYTERLRRTAKGYDNGGILGMVINDCADKIDELEKRIVELEEALKSRSEEHTSELQSH